MRRIRIEPGRLRPTRLVPPPGKSEAIRSLVLGRIVGRREPFVWARRMRAELPHDVVVVADGLAALDRRVGGRREVRCGAGAAPFRFLLVQASVAPGRTVRFWGSRRLGARPRRPLLASLRGALGGAGLVLRGGRPWPVVVTGAGGIASARFFRVDARQSGQFVSALLLGAAALARRHGRAWTVGLEGPCASAGYVALTVRWLSRCGFSVRAAGGAFTVAAGAAPRAWPEIPGDWSSGACLLLLAWRSGGRVYGLRPAEPHPDRAILAYLRRIGLTVRTGADGGMSVSGRASRGLEVSAHETPDLVPVLAALACALPGRSVVRGVPVLRGKESDRLSGISSLLSAAGARMTRSGDAIGIVPGPGSSRPIALHSAGDHRMAMAAALLAVLTCRRVNLERPDCVAKSYPGFFRTLAASGVRLFPVLTRSRGDRRP